MNSTACDFKTFYLLDKTIPAVRVNLTEVTRDLAYCSCRRNDHIGFSKVHMRHGKIVADLGIAPLSPSCRRITALREFIAYRVFKKPLPLDTESLYSWYTIIYRYRRQFSDFNRRIFAGE